LAFIETHKDKQNSHFYSDIWESKHRANSYPYFLYKETYANAVQIQSVLTLHSIYIMMFNQ